MFTFQRNGYTLVYDAENACIHSLTDGRREYVGEEIAIFKMALLDEEGNREIIQWENMSFKSAEQSEQGFQAVYTGCGLEVTVSAEIADHIEWKIAMDVEDNRVLEWVDFPRIVVPHELKDNGGTSKILWGFNEGGIVDDLSYRQNGDFYYRDLQYPSISCLPLYPAIVESQFMAYFDEVGGLYFGAHDVEDNVKGIDFIPCGTGILLQYRHFCGVERGAGYQMAFPMVLEFFRGQWQDAARIYKTWFTANKTEGFVPITENKKLPDWYGESPVVIAYPVRGLHDTDVMNPNKLFPYINGLEHVERLEKELNSKIMVILMQWEGSAPWAPPYVWPPFGGEEALKEYIDALHARGDVVGVYCSGMGWTQFSRVVDDYNKEAEFEEKNLKEVMCLSPKQELPYCKIVTNIRAGYDMCPSQQFTRDVLKQEVKSMVDAGIDYIQLLDQNHGGTSYFCYSKDHGHPPVPGKWQVDAVKGMMEEIHEHTGKVLLGCESAAAESYIPHLMFSDNRYMLNYGCGTPVPLYAYLYHEYINNFMGNQVCAHGYFDHQKSPDNLLMRMGYSFAAGDMLTLVLNDDGNIIWNYCWSDMEYLPDQENIKEFVKNTNAWRRGLGKKYLHSGNMVKPYMVKCEKNHIHGTNDHIFEIEKIYSTAWESAEGTYGQFLVNYNTEDTECEIYLPEGEYRLYEDEDHFVTITGGCQKITVKKLSAALIERV